MAETAVARVTPTPAPSPAAGAAHPLPVRHTGPPVHRLRAVATPPAAGSLPAPAYDVVRAPGVGEQLAPGVRAPLATSLGVDLDPVRVHADSRAHAAARSVGARAFAYGVHVFLGPGERTSDLGLIAHEVTHVVQQQGGATVQAYGGRADGFEREAARVSQSVRQGERTSVSGRTTPRIQRSVLGRAWDATGGRVVHAVEEGVEAGVQWLEDRAWGLVRRFAPELEPILRQGILEWLKERIGAALEAVWNTLMAPVRSVTDFIESLRAHFRNLVDWMREAAGKLARGDCSSIAEAAQKVQDVVSGLASPIIDRVKHAAQRVGDFFTSLWNRFGAPVWQWLRELGGAIWERIQAFGSWLWEKTQPIRDALSRAWTWIKNKLGIGEGPEGQNGLLQWVQRKAGEAWDWLKARIEPYKRQLLVIAGVLVMLSPAGPIIAIGAAVGGLIYGARWLAQHLRSRNAVVQDRGLLEGRIIPGIQGAVNAVASALSRAAAWVSEKLLALVGHFSSAAGAIAGSIFRFALGAVQWLLGRFQSLAAWATEQVQGLAGYVRSGLNRLLVWLEPLLGVLRALGRVVADIFNIVVLVMTRVWNAIPACIRNPIVDFITNQILRRVPIFSSLLAIPDIWTRIRTTAMRVIQQVFRNGDLAGAAMTVFRFLLDVLQVPIDLVRAIFTKAASVLDLILADPVRFLRNVLSALKQGFVQFFGAIGRHLLSGVVNWLFGQLQQAGITVPTELSFGSIFRLILDVLGITLERVLAILARKVGQPIVDRIRRVLGFLTGVWEFVSRLITEGPAGLWRYVVERLSNLWETARDMIIGWITNTIIGQVSARLLSMLDPTGIMAVVNSILAFYRAVQSALEYLRQILEIVNTWLDTLAGIAAGAIGSAATMFENLLDRAMPVAIGFLANQVGLRGLGHRIHEMIASIQERVEQAIEWLIDRALAAGRAILERLGVGGGGGRVEVPFEVDGERHRVFLSDSATAPTVMVASVEEPAAAQMLDFERRASQLPTVEARAQATQLIASTRAKLTEWSSRASRPDPGSSAYLQELAHMLVPLYTLFHISVPVTEVVFDPISVTVDGRSGTQGHVVAAQPLTKRQGTVVGSGSRSRWTPADSRISGLNAIGENWVKVHLLHGPDLHGPNDPQNFAPGPSTTNTEIYNDIELKAIEAVEDNQVLWYATEATYAQPDPDDSMFPSTIRVEWGAFDHTAGRRTRTNASKSYPIRPPGEGRSVASLSYDGRVMLQRVGGLRPAYATAIAEARRRSGLAPFDSFAAVGFALTYSQGRADVENIIKDIQARAVAGKLRL